MARSILLLLFFAVVALSWAPRVTAFGAGNIPSFSYLEDKAFRHGDIEDIIEKLIKTAGGGLFARGTKFSPLDVKRVYMGNWLRDYSQAVDVGALKKTNLQTILNVVMVLGFLAHGYATAEFEVTKERLGCYLPTEHIDNPKGYADGEDARQYDPRLRGPVDPRELEIDPQTGMKNYIANEGGNWDTSKALVRRTLERCIAVGRQFHHTGNKYDQYEAFRLLGQSLHTLEDFTAHSNWCELALISFGYTNVFPHVGRNVKIRSPHGRDVAPLVTGTFGGADFIHSLMGEATDHLSQASVSDLSKSMANARSISEGQTSSANTLRQLLFDLPGGGDAELTREMDAVQGMRAGQPGGVDPSTMSPQELHRVLWQVLSFRDSVMKKIENTIDRVPGLGSLVEKISNSVAVFIMTTIEPFLKPLLGTATSALGESSQAVIDSHDQYEVWNDWNASDPTHSFLSKDHFGLILNEPAGLIAKFIVEYTVERVVRAWDDPNMPTQVVTEDVLQCLFHPDFIDPKSQLQTLMLERMRKWVDSTGGHKQELINRLSADNVKEGKNRRIGDTSGGGHVHNSMLPEGGLQSVLAQHNVHVPGAGVLNAGQDLLGGKMPWQQGFGTGGQHAWRDIDPNDAAAAASMPGNMDPSYGQPPLYDPSQQSYSPQPGYQGQANYSGQPDYSVNQGHASHIQAGHGSGGPHGQSQAHPHGHPQGHHQSGAQGHQSQHHYQGQPDYQGQPNYQGQQGPSTFGMAVVDNPYSQTYSGHDQPGGSHYAPQGYYPMDQQQQHSDQNTQYGYPSSGPPPPGWNGQAPYQGGPGNSQGGWN